MREQAEADDLRARNVVKQFRTRSRAHRLGLTRPADAWMAKHEQPAVRRRI